MGGSLFDMEDGPGLVQKSFYLRVAQAIGFTVEVIQRVVITDDEKGGKKRRLLRALQGGAEDQSAAGVQDVVANATQEGTDPQGVVDWAQGAANVTRKAADQATEAIGDLIDDIIEKKKGDDGDKKDSDSSDSESSFDTEIFTDFSVNGLGIVLFALIFMYLALKCKKFNGGDFKGPATLGGVADVFVIILFFTENIPQEEFMLLAFIATAISLPFSYGIYKNYG